MSWCPRCDEVFPEGPTCPRCRSALVDPSEAPRAHEIQGVGELPELKVSRRLERAFDRIGGQPSQPRAILAIALAVLFFAGGFLAGRMGSVVGNGPTMRTLEAQPFPYEIDGALAYVATQPDLSREPALVRHDLVSGAVDTVARFGLPPGLSPTARNGSVHLTSFGRSTGVVLGGPDDRSQVGVFPSGHPFPMWLTAHDAAWEGASSLLIRRDERLIRWTVGEEPAPAELEGRWTGLFQTADGAVALRDDRRLLTARGSEGWREGVRLPEDVEVLAAAPGGRAALVQRDGETGLWDGEMLREVRMEGFRPLGAAFSRDGSRSAVVLAEGGSADAVPTTVAILDARGNPAFRSLENTARAVDCVPVPAWDASGRWVFVAAGDGAVYAVDASSARVHRAPVRAVGCGITWIP